MNTNIVHAFVLGGLLLLAAVAGVYIWLAPDGGSPAPVESPAGSSTAAAGPEVLSLDRFQDESYYDAYRTSESTQLVVAIGDSFTAGFPVDVDDAYPSVLERVLGERGIDARVMNAGRVDTGLDEHLALLTDQILARLDPDIVVVQLHPNDTANNATKPEFSVSGDNQLVPDPGAEPPEGIEPIDWGRQKFRLEIERIEELARQRGFEVIFALVAPQSIYNDDTTAEWALFERVEYESMWDVLDDDARFVEVRFDEADIGSGAGIFAAADRDGMEYGLRRFNERGHERFAERIADRIVLTSGEWVPVVDLAFDPPQSEWMVSGWNDVELAGDLNYAWSEGPTSVIESALPSNTPLRVTLAAQRLEVPDGSEQQVEIVVNGQLIDTLTLGPGRQVYDLMLPGEVLTSPTARIELNYAYNYRPLDVIPGSEDTRSLAVAWYAIGFSRQGG